jgi:hypothetical protein
MGAFKEPHGGELRELYLTESNAENEKLAAADYSSWNLTDRQLCDLELLLNGAFSPLDGFLSRAEYDSVLARMRLPSGLVWPIPINLDVSREFAASIKPGDRIGLRDPEGVLIATMEVGDIWEPDKAAEARSVFGTTDEHHPGVHFLNQRTGPVYVGGKLRGVEPPMHYDFKILRDSPSELRGRFRKLGWRKVVAFQTRNPMHRAHQELTFRAARETEGQPAAAPRGRHDAARRHRSLHARAMLRARAQALPGADDRAEPAEPRDAHGGAEGSALARDHPQELRLHAPDRRARSRRTWSHRRVNPITDRTPRRSCCASTRRKSKSR